MTLENRMNDFEFEIVSEPDTETEEVSFIDQLADSAIEANEILKELEGR
jgi:hypothetical protein